MKLIPFQFEHLELFDWRPEEQKIYSTGGAFVSALISADKSGDCFTAMHDGRILVIGGIVRQSAKTGYAFTMFSKHADAYPTVSARLVKRMFSRLIETMGLHRLVTYNLPQAEVHHKWVKWLGFGYEGYVRKFDDEGNDYLQFGLVINGT